MQNLIIVASFHVHNSSVFKYGNKIEDSVVVNSFSLVKTLCHKYSLEGVNLSIMSYLSFVDQVTPNISNLFGWV